MSSNNIEPIIITKTIEVPVIKECPKLELTDEKALALVGLHKNASQMSLRDIAIAYYLSIIQLNLRVDILRNQIKIYNGK